MNISYQLYSLLFILLLIPSSTALRMKRQLSIDELISRALSLVRPIFDTSQPLQNDEMLKKKPNPSPDDMRDTNILGSRPSSILDDLPLCKGNSRICQFISCSAENFKKDAAFGNLQLAAQVLGDSKLRNAISNNPEAIDAVCKEQGMTEGECKIFSKGFQLIDKFITTIEKPKEKPKSPSSPMARPSMPMDDEPMSNPRVDLLTPLHDDYDLLPSAVSSSPPGSPPIEFGSKTWSSQVQPRMHGAQLLEVRDDLVASLTPLPIIPFSHPTVPTAPPLAFPTVPSFIFPPFKLPEFGKETADIFGIKRQKREAEEKSIDKRLKRAAEYYDDIQEEKKESSKKSRNTSDDDYYGNVEDDSEENSAEKKPQSALKNCVNLLGLIGE